MIKNTNNFFKVVIITSYPFPDSAATANRVSILAKEISLKSHFNVVILGPGPSETMERVAIKQPGNYSVISVNHSTIRQSNLLLRALGEIKQTWHLLKKAQSLNADFYIVTIPSIFLILTPTILRTKVIIFDFRDLLWEYLIKLGGTKKFIGSITKFTMPYFLRRAKAITVTNHFEKEELSKLTQVPIEIVGNGISQDRFNILKVLKPTLCDNPYKVIYIGNLGIAQKLETLLEAIGGDENFEIVLIGDGSRADFLKGLTFHNNMTNVKFTGALQWQDILSYIKQSNCLYGQIAASYTSAVPSKLFEYLSCGRPVVFGLPDGAARDLVSSFENIYICTPENPNELREKMEALRRDMSDVTLSISSNRHKIQQNHLRENEAKRLIGIIESYIEE